LIGPRNNRILRATVRPFSITPTKLTKYVVAVDGSPESMNAISHTQNLLRPEDELTTFHLQHSTVDLILTAQKQHAVELKSRVDSKFGKLKFDWVVEVGVPPFILCEQAAKKRQMYSLLVTKV